MRLRNNGPPQSHTTSHPTMPSTTEPESESRYDRRRTILALHNTRKIPAEIHRVTGYPESSVRLILPNYHKRGHAKDLPQSGRPPALSHWDQKWMENIVVNEPTSTIDKALRPQISYYTQKDRSPGLNQSTAKEIWVVQSKKALGEGGAEETGVNQ